MIPAMDSFWQELKQAGVVKGPCPEAAHTYSPWYVRVLLGLSGWLAAIFLLGFVATGLRFIIKNHTASVTVGCLTVGVAYVLLRATRNDFAEQFSLALSLAGQALLLFGLLEIFQWDGAVPWLATAALQTVVAVIMPSPVQRMIAGYFAVMTFWIAMAHLGSPFIVPILAALAAAIFWNNEFHWHRYGTTLRPIAYGLTLSLLQLKGQLFFDETLILHLVGGADTMHFLRPQWVGQLATGLILLAVVVRLMSQRGAGWASKPMAAAVLVTVTIAAVSFEAPGVSTGLMIVLLGFANSNRVLLGLGIAALLFYLSAYYYTLQATLLTKSEILAATGTALLLARWVVSRWIFDNRENTDA